MSERMIELQRARLLASKGPNNSGAGASSGSAPNGSQASSSGGKGARFAATGQPRRQQTPQEIATNAQRSDDSNMQKFLHLLQDRNDCRAQSASGPTVPVVLSRRVLHRQGVGFLDETVAAVVSGAADRFLGTVLQQAAACRDQRLKGTETAREARRQRKRHIEQYEADAAERTRRKEEAELRRAKLNDARIAAADALKKGSSKAEGTENTPKSKKKKKTDDSAQTNGQKQNEAGDDAQDDNESYDSVDEEEQYYREHYGDGNSVGSEDDDDEDALTLRDISRPLEAWGFRLLGKSGMEPPGEEESDDEADSDSEAGKDEVAGSQLDPGDMTGDEKDTSGAAKKQAAITVKPARSPESEKAAKRSTASPVSTSRAATPVKLA